MAISQNVISTFRRKNTTGNYDTFYLGSEQRYSSALSTSNNNNLEEQLLMGVDRIIKSWHDNTTNTDRRTIEFRRDSDVKNYYILDVTITRGNDVYVENGIVYFSNGTNMRVEGNIMAQTQYDSKISYNDNDEMLVTNFSVIREEDVLYYVQNDGTRLKVSSKSIIKTVDENNVVTVKEEITNYL